VLELSQARETLNAHDLAGGSRAQPVTAVFTNAASGSAPKPGGAAGLSGGSLVRVGSRRLLYSGVENKAVFDGGVIAEVPSGIMHSSVMEVDLAGSSPSSSPQKLRQGQAQQVEHIIARGEVQLEQPGRQGTGSQLVYTAQDGRFVLTGSSSLPPRLVDRVRGTVTGTSLIFNDRDDSVMVSSGASKAVTQTRVAK
jgi:lipopolysaccharide export system protein LptA